MGQLPSEMRIRGCMAPFTAMVVAASAAAAAGEPELERVTLDAAIQRALEHNPSTRSAVQQVKLAYAQMEEVRSASLPTATANAVYTRLSQARGTPAAVLAPVDQGNGNLQVSVPLLSPRAWANWARAADQVDVTRLSFWDTQRLVAVATARAYLTVYAQHLAVDVALRARENARAHLAFAQKRLQGGLGNRLDAVRAAQEVSADEAQLETYEAQLARAREALGVLMGVDGHAVDVTEQPPEGQLPEPPGLDAALDGARKRRTDVKVSERRTEAADRSLNMSYTEYLPTLLGVLQGFVNQPPTVVAPSSGWQAQLLFSFPLYDGGLRYGLTHEREANLGLSQLGLEATLREAESNARAAYEALQRARASFQSARSAAQLAHEALKLADLAYRAGATTELDMIDAERQARDADTAAASSEDQALQAQVDLLDASGFFPRS